MSITKTFKDGTQVYITNLKSTGTIIGTMFRMGKVDYYEVSYFAGGGEYRVIQLRKYEFDSARVESEPVGYYVEKNK
jgi:hypothetical protein